MGRNKVILVVSSSALLTFTLMALATRSDLKFLLETNSKFVFK